MTFPLAHSLAPTWRSRRQLAVAVALLAGLLVGAPGGITPADAKRPSTTAAAAVARDGWDEVTPESAGMDDATMFPAKAYAFQEDRHTQSVVVTRGGHVVTEWYAPGEGPQSWAASWSMAKSFTSALVGIAIGEGKIADADVSMATFFPDWAGTDKAKIRLSDVLHMESGLKWSEDYNPDNVGASDIIQMGIVPDQLAYAASRPVDVPPGTRFNYSSGDAMLLSHVIEVATGMPADEYARQKLFGPLGISQVEWWRDGAGHTLTYCCLDTTSRNYARMGLLYLRHGQWNGQQVVPASWVDASWAPTANSGGNYGFQWWIEHSDKVDGPIYMMNGHDGQFTYVIPSLDMVVVRNGDYVKSECDPVADPTLFGPYPPSGLAPGRGTTPPASWNHDDLLGPIVDAITGDSPLAEATPAAETPTNVRNPQGDRMDPCAADQPTTTTTTSVTPGPVVPPAPSRPATPVSGRPSYTG